MAITYGEALPQNQNSNVIPLPSVEKRNHMKFMLLIHPDRWVFDPGVQDWLPELGKLILSGGVNGVALDPNGREIATEAIANKTQLGWIPINDGDARLDDLIPNGKYLARHPAAPHGFAYSWIWEGFERVRNTIDWGEDAALRIKFQRGLEAKGLIGSPKESLLRLDLREAKARCIRLGDRAAKNQTHPSILYRAEAAAQHLKTMEAAFEKRFPKPAVKGK